MNVLVGCEESQTVCNAFRVKGHKAFSNDLKPCSGGHPEYHLQMDVVKAIQLQKWDIIILHPECTYMALSGNRWYYNSIKRIEAIQWTVRLWELATSVCNKVALENPASVIFKHLAGGALQYVQPWQFGHGETKKTGFYLCGLPQLFPTNIVTGREQRIWKMSPSENRKELRSKTYPGIAQAMADQWGDLKCTQ